MPVVAFSRVGLHYGTGPAILQGLDFELEQGAFHFLTGASGAGKTSLMKLLYLAQKPTQGRITMFGHDLSQLGRHVLPALRRQIGIVFQDYRLMPHLSAFDNVALPLRAAGVDDRDVRKRVTELLEWVGLGMRIYAKPETLSGGEQQRVAIARAVINRPRLLLADEPTGSVDPDIGARILHLFSELNHHGTTVVIATHDEDTVARFPYPELRLEHGSLRIRPPKTAVAA